MELTKLPDHFQLTSGGTGSSFGITYATIVNEKHHTLGGTWVSFVVDGYSPGDGETLRIRKKRGLLGAKLVLTSPFTTREHDVSHFGTQ